MNNSLINKSTSSVNIRDLFWMVLSQWKAILIVALLMAMITTGFKHYKDVKAFNEAVEKQREAIEMESKPVDERIDSVLATLSEDEIVEVEYLLEQKEWVAETKDYINNSILLNTDPTNQRTLVLNYCLDVDNGDSSDAITLAYAYSACFTDDKVIDEVRKIISPEADRKYIIELITTPFFGNRVNNVYDDEVILEGRIVLPEQVDATDVEKVITKALADYSEELGSKVSKHTISLIRASEESAYNITAITNKNSLIANINNIENSYIKTYEGMLSSEQREAIDAIVAIKKTADYNAVTTAPNTNKKSNYIVEDELAHPGYSKKYFLLGFILGILVYVGVVVLIIILGGYLVSPDVLATYSGNRILGEVYYPVKTTGIKVLFQSGIINKLRYYNKGDISNQIDSTISTIESVCKHAKVADLTMLNMIGTREEAFEILNKIISGIEAKGIDINVTDIGNNFDERMLLPVKNVVIVASRNNKLSEVLSLTGLCHSYEISQIGNVFINPK